jgi:hypothetical protein
MTYGIIPNGKQQFINSNGQPLAGGSVYYYIPSTTTFKNTYQNDSGSVLNTNPIVLDANGQCIAYGSGSYRQQVYDVYNNLIWDVQIDSPSIFNNASSFTSDGSTTSFTLAISPSNVDSVFVSINGVNQSPTTNYTVSGSTLTLSSAAPITSVISVRY